MNANKLISEMPTMVAERKAKTLAALAKLNPTQIAAVKAQGLAMIGTSKESILTHITLECIKEIGY